MNAVRFLFATLLLALLPGIASSKSLPVARVFASPAVTLFEVSPGGGTLAFRSESEGIQYLNTMDLRTLKVAVLGKFETTRLLNLFWKNDEILMLTVQSSDGSTELRSCDFKTGKSVWLSNHVGYNTATLLSILPDDPEHLLFEIEIGGAAFVSRYNTRTGKETVIEKGERFARRWILNRQHEPAGAVCLEGKKYYYRWRIPGTKEWQSLELGPADEAPLWPLVMHSDGRLLATDRTEPGPAALVALDPTTGRKEVLFRHASVDWDRILLWDPPRTDVIGIVYEDDRRRVHFLDSSAAKLQARIDATFPDTFNEIVSASRDRNVAVFLATSDRESGKYYLLNQKTGQLAPIGPAFPGDDASAMGSSRAFTFKNKDGAVMSGRLLLPPGNPVKPPVIVMVGSAFAGPRTRELFDAKQQAFATRGYAVARFNYRGCPGFGREFTRSGDFQFTTGMVDDILAGLDHLVAENWVNGEKAVLFGQGNGGLIAIHALGRAHSFKAWLNRDTLTATQFLDFDQLAVSPDDDKEVIETLGGKRAAQQARQSLDPKPILPRIKIPSFHAYFKPGDLVDRDSTAISEYLSKHPGAGKLIHVSPGIDRKKPSANEAAALQAMIDFLGQHVPVQP
jgi:alpha/beta superfamily hydrolase